MITNRVETMKPISDMTDKEIQEARAGGAIVYGARLGRVLESGECQWTELEDFNEDAIDEKVSGMRQRGWFLDEEWTQTPAQPEK